MFAAVESPSLALAFAAGFVSFVSPCVLPLVPGYLAAVSGAAPAGERRVDARMLARSLVFVATFSSIFMLLGLSATAAGSLLRDNKAVLDKVAGVTIIAMGIFFVASVFVVRLNREWHPEQLVERAGRGGPVLAGAAFAIAWTPCVGPALGAILGLAAQDGTVGKGALLLGVYSLGLAVPFLFSAVAFSAAQRSFAFFKRHYAGIQVGAGLVLVAMGILVLDGELNRLNSEAQQFLDRFGLNFFQDV
ncbi:MAG: cytochrome c biogenesis protein CcdA [Actinomycetota bacterium]|nr:cytochrome c biogenesis protein CcdA [Actinomycetota bacterium]